VNAFRHDGMRRSSSRHSGTGLAIAVTRLAGSGVTRSAGSGTIVDVIDDDVTMITTDAAIT
jgi:hypothetical protein